MAGLDAAWFRRARLAPVSVTAVGVLLITVSELLSAYRKLPPAVRPQTLLAFQLAVVLLTVPVIAATARPLRLRLDAFAAIQVFDVIHRLEAVREARPGDGSPVALWWTTDRRVSVAADLEFAAATVEHIPMAFRHISAAARQDAFLLARSRAAALRAIQRDVLTPAADPLPALVSRLCRALIPLSKGRWWELPPAVARPEDTPRKQWWPIGIAVVALAAVIALVVVRPPVGAGASVLIAILDVLIVLAFNSAGVPSAKLEQATSLGAFFRDERKDA